MPPHKQRARSQQQARLSQATAIQMDAVSGGPVATSISFVGATQLSFGDKIPSGNPVKGNFYGHGDGALDAAIVVGDSSGAYSLATIRGNGDGTFGTPAYTSLGTAAPYYEVLAADLNGDGLTDIVLLYSGSAVIYIASSNGVFTQGNTYPFAGDIVGGALADVNGDSKLDLLVATYVGDTGASVLVYKLLGNGNGTFQADSSPVVLSGANLSNAVFADLNGDGKPDLIGIDTSPSHNIQVYLATSSGYAAAASYAPPDSHSQFSQLTVADVNGDGKPDIIAADYELSQAVVYLNNGNGTFRAGVGYSTGHESCPSAVGVADLNGDGNADLVAVNYDSGDITVLLGKGDGTFSTPRVGYATGGQPWYRPLIADFSGNGKLDVIVQDEMFNLVYLRGYGDGTFRAAVNYYATPSPTIDPNNLSDLAWSWDVATGDLNGDGKPDVVVGNYCNAVGNYCNAALGVTVFLNNGDGTFKPGVNYGSGGGLQYVRLADMNGDGKLDIVASDYNNHRISVFYGYGDGTFQAPVTYYDFDSQRPEALAIADFNGDGKPDVAVVIGGQILVLLNDGMGGGRLADTHLLTGYGTSVNVSDINGDGKPDLLIAQDDGNVAVLLGQGDGTFQEAPGGPVAFGNSVRDIAVGDFNGDGKLDLAVTIRDCCDANYHTKAIAVALGNGDGSFQTPVQYQPSTLHPFVYNGDTQENSPGPNGIRAVDLDQDGKLDLVWANGNYGTLAIAYGKGDGTFYDPIETPTGGNPAMIAVADFNGDGAMDIVTANSDMVGVTILLNAGSNKVTVASSPNPSLQAQLITFTASVNPIVRGVSTVPTGSVTFMDGSTALGSVALNGGSGSINVAILSDGSHYITATYSGDPNFLPSSGGIAQVVNALPPDFTVSADQTTVTLQAGSTGVFIITVAPNLNFSGSVSFACNTPLPIGVTCNFSPNPVIVNGGPASTTLTVKTKGATSIASLTPLRRGVMWAGFGGFGAVGWVLLGAGAGGRRKRWLAFGALMLVLLTALWGCGGGGGSTTSTAESASSLNQTPSGMQAIHVSVASGAIGHTTDININVQ
jgi:hypothetical protein